ncbi:pseudouridine synthase [Ammonifex degensii KC4]|uniref:Pseudouridine synthase n=1 Tax=Ammonifex degensii (strain DSM 10501 / KC4) TaxID=429009 RepID=C9R7X1_AMMDK|nr:pseudouridine synthase [Ammonifex degensii]ACX52400.1 pseudouridine synthase [Ammonifex degensii KC4]
MPEERLQKVLARAGIASRRKAEELIVAGRVKVNGQVVDKLGVKVDPERDSIEVDGKPVKLPERLVYLAFHKPRGVVTTLHDPQGRPKVADFLKGIKERVFPVGRLDYDSEGLLLLTNDGELAHRLLHPRFHVPKTYLVWVKGEVGKEKLNLLRRGIKLEDGPTLPAEVRVLRRARGETVLQLTIREGRKRQIRRMLKALGCEVLRLKRVAVGPVRLGPLRPGEYRHLTPREVDSLRKAAGLVEVTKKEFRS